MKLSRFFSPLVALGMAVTAQAQPVTTLSVASGPGGNIERYGRIFQKYLPEWLGRPVAFEHKPGGAGQVALQHGAKSNMAPHFVLGIVSYDSALDQAQAVVPVVPLGELGMVLYTHADGPKVSDITSPGTKVYSMGMPNQPNPLQSGFVKAMNGRLNVVLYPSAAKQITDVLGRHLDIGASVPANIRSHIEAGTLRPLLVFNGRRLGTIPDTPTTAELGIKFPEDKMYSWMMLWASPNTSPADIAKVRQEYKKWVTSPEGIDTLKAMDIVPNTEPDLSNPSALIKRITSSK